MKRRFRSYDYWEEYRGLGDLAAIHIRIRDYLLHKTYYAEWAVGITFAHGHCFYDDQHEVIEGCIEQELHDYTEQAFLWRVNEEIRKYEVLNQLRRDSQTTSAHIEDGAEHGTVSLA